MDKIYEQTMLYDFYGELLTDHQKSIYEDAVYNDMSLAEIAKERGISRQGVHDLLRRCDRILQEYERKLHLVERFARAKETVSEIKRLAGVVSPDVGKASAGKSMADQNGAEAVSDAVPDTYADMLKRLKGIGRLAQELMEEL